MWKFPAWSTIPPVVRPRSSASSSKSVDLLAPHPVRPTGPPPPLAEAEGPDSPEKTKGRKRTKPQTIEVRRIHRRDLNAVWEFLKISFRDVNRATVEYQRPRTKQHFLEIYEKEGVEQLLFTIDRKIVAYAECTFEIVGKDTWLNPAYFDRRDMRPLYVEELAVHPDYEGRGVGSFVLEQLQHLARVRGLTHLVLEVAENNENALSWYRKRNFRKLDAAIFLAQAVTTEPELLPPASCRRRATGRSRATRSSGSPREVFPVIGRTLSHFRIESKLGEGGMGVVYRATDEKLLREVALKILPASLANDTERRQRFLREARSAAAVTHPSIATVYEVDEAEGLVFIAMELVLGETLRERMAPGLTHAEALRIAGAVARGLSRAHGKGVVHRDLKPENVMITADGEVKILDFGLAKLRAAESGDAAALGAMDTAAQLTAQGRVMGTPGYMSPEQIEGRAEVDARSDVFSFGVMLYEMLSGVRPFRGSSSIEVLYGVLHRDLQPLEEVCPTVPSDIAAFVTRCLAKRPEERYASGRELVIALEGESLPRIDEALSARAPALEKIRTVSGMGTALGATISSAAPQTGPAPSIRRRRYLRSRWLWMGVAMTLVVVGAVVGRADLDQAPARHPHDRVPGAQDEQQRGRAPLRLGAVAAARGRSREPERAAQGGRSRSTARRRPPAHGALRAVLRVVAGGAQEQLLQGVAPRGAARRP